MLSLGQSLAGLEPPPSTVAHTPRRLRRYQRLAPQHAVDVSQGADQPSVPHIPASQQLQQAVPDSPVLSRRGLLTGAAAAAAGVALIGSPQAAQALSSASCLELYQNFLTQPLDYSKPGPLIPVHLPRLETVCTRCFTSCAGTNCLVRINVTYPKGGPLLGLGPPYPLAILTAGFLISSDSYKSYADRLASWGYCVILYDKLETVSDFLDDVTSVKVIQHLIDWARSDPLLRRVADTNHVYLVGHSRGGKLSTLAAAQDPRVSAVCLLDPVDTTVYAPLAPGFPSALAALRGEDFEHSGPLRAPPSHVLGLPLAVVGSGLGGDCAPRGSNYSQFFTAAQGPAWQVLLPEAGHFEYLDAASPLQKAVCPGGSTPADQVRLAAQTVVVAWGELMVRHRGRDVLSLPPGAAYPLACGSPEAARQPSMPQQRAAKPFPPSPSQQPQVSFGGLLPGMMAHARTSADGSDQGTSDSAGAEAPATPGQMSGSSKSSRDGTGSIFNTTHGTDKVSDASSGNGDPSSSTNVSNSAGSSTSVSSGNDNTSSTTDSSNGGTNTRSVSGNASNGSGGQGGTNNVSSSNGRVSNSSSIDGSGKGRVSNSSGSGSSSSSGQMLSNPLYMDPTLQVSLSQIVTRMRYTMTAEVTARTKNLAA